jgi:hypothetical protein
VNNFYISDQDDHTGLEKVSRYESDKNSLSNTYKKDAQEESESVNNNNKTSIINEKGESEDQ